MSEEPKKRGRKPKEEVCALLLPRLRDDRGLLKGAEYEFDRFGFINWRKLVSPEYVVLNRKECGKIGIDTKLISKEEKEKYLVELGDDKKLIKLAGFRELSRIRGVKSVDQPVHEGNSGVVYCQTKIVFIPNIETDYQELSYTAVASASVGDVAPEYSNFLAAIASNRAFGRCVREALGISVVTEEEMNPNEIVEVNSSGACPQSILEDKCKAKNISFETVLKGLEGQGIELDSGWVNFRSLPAYHVITAMELIKK